MTKKNLLKILFVEDLPSDAELAVMELRKEGLRFEHLRVENRDELIMTLKEFKPDLIISDYMMPSYNGMLALIDTREFDPLMPFILCTGSMNEETAVECLKAGATDYVIKEHLTRLPFAVKEAIEQHRILIEKRAADLLLKENEEKLQSIFRAAPVGIGLLVDRVFLEVNDTFCTMTGYTRKELVGKSSEMVYATNEEYESVGIDKYRQIAEKGTGSVETRFKSKDGRILNIFLSSTPLEKDDLTKGVTFTVMDITDRIQAEEALANEKYLIYSLMSTLPDHIYFKDRQSRFIRINKAQAQFFGLSDPGQAVGKTDSDFFSGEHANQAYEDEQTIIRTGKSISIEEKETHLNRPDTWVSTVKLPLRDRYENIIGTFGISRDITERKLAEEALLKSQHLFQTLAQVSPVGIFRTDPDGNTTYVNPKWMELSGLSSEEAFGNGWLNAVHREDRETISKSWVINLKSKNESSAEYRFLKPDGSVIWVMGKAVPEFIGNEVKGYIGTITDITEHKQSEEVLRKSQQIIEGIINAIPVRVFWKDENLVYLGCNTIFAHDAGYDNPGDMIGKNDYQMGWSDQAEMYRADDKQVIESGLPKILIEESQTTPKGNLITLLTSKIPLRGTKGEINGVLGTYIDITERKQAEEALRESEEKYRRIFENVQDVYYETSIEGSILEVSPSIEILSGGQYKRTDLIGKSMYDFYSDPNERAALISQLKESGTVSDFEIMLKNRDGSKVPCSITTKICFDARGYPQEMIGSMHDITARKLMEAVMRESEQRYRELFLNNPIPTYIFDTETLAFIEVNDATIQSYGFSHEEFAQMTLRDIRIDKDISDLLESVKSLGNEAFHSRSMRHCKKDGTVFPVNISSHELPEKNGKRSRLVMVNDITEQVKAEEKLKLAKEKAEASDKLKTTFLNNISHEVRTPLNGILGFAEIMSQIEISEEEKRASLTMLYESSDRLLNTITNYMDISLINSGTMSLYKKDFLPVQILRELNKKIILKCSARSLELFMEIPEQYDKLVINSDPEIFRKILAHLLDNAIKFTEKGSIKYGFTVHESELEFFIKDTGIGIGQEYLEKVFEHFVKEDRGPLKLTEGSGLGLPISKGLVELLGGKIRVESGKGKGSAFFFTVPVEKEFGAHILSPPVVEKKKNKTINSILVAEDDEINFFYLRALLKQNTTAEIIHATNGKDALEKFQKNPQIGLILMDIKMPVMDGLEATRLIKAINRRIPVIAITAHAMTGDETRILDAGCDYYLVKPIDSKLLLEKIAEYIIL
jgi:PAS domain S-box-containing protein